MQLTFHTLDVFTDTRFCGNPLAVVMGADQLTTPQMQTIAREFNLSETIFVMRPADPANTAKVRIFFPTDEIPFAGHPTIGCSILLAQLAHGDEVDFDTEIRLEEVAGLVPVKVVRSAGVTRAQLTAPVIPFQVGIALPPVELAASALGLDPGEIGFDAHGLACIEGGPRFFFVPLASPSALARARTCEPFWSQLIEMMPKVDCAYLYARGGRAPGCNYQSRMYAPNAGTPEDPATGSATALLTAQLLVADALGDGTHKWQIEQGYDMGRPSDLSLEADVQGGALTAVRLAGGAVRIMAGELTV